MRLRQRVREFAYAHGFGMDEQAEQSVLDGKAGVPPGSLVNGKLLAVQVAKNKFTPDEDLEAVKRDYVYCVDALSRYADIVVVNGELFYPTSSHGKRSNSSNSLKSKYTRSERYTASRQTHKHPHWRSCGFKASNQEEEAGSDGQSQS